jgi:mono/diheme cytochrome c family protein
MTIRAACALAAFVATACTSATDGIDGPTSSEVAELRHYDDDATFRREVLERSLVNPSNAYSRLRLEAYTDARWGSLPEWNPEVRTSDAATWQKLDVASARWEDGSLIELGRRAFFEYPTQLDVGDRVPRTVVAHVPDGSAVRAFTCASCHASTVDGMLIAGRNDPDADVQDVSTPGRVDVTDDGVDDPIAIPDLRPIRFQTNMHHAATWRNGLVPLAIRIETLIVTSLGGVVRPPRKVAAALALYLWSLGAQRREPAEGLGADVFARECSGCHSGAGLSGSPVALDAVGTSPLVGRSADRGTGFLRVPSLVHVGDRRRLFGSGEVDDIAMLLDPSRTAAGHRFGLALSVEERAALLAYLQSL